MLIPSSGSAALTVRWRSILEQPYFVERGTNLAAPFSVIQNEIEGLVDTTSYADTNAPGDGPFFYRVGVSE